MVTVKNCPFDKELVVPHVFEKNESWMELLSRMSSSTTLWSAILYSTVGAFKKKKETYTLD
jgi:hypothetical protein